MSAKAYLAGVAVGLVSCSDVDLPPEGHVVVFVETNAPLPRTGTTTASDRPMPLLDTVRIEIVTADGKLACDRCRREVSLDEALVDKGGSFTIVPANAQAREARLHAIAFRAEHVATAGLLATVETWARVPERPASGAREVTLTLPVEEIGKPRGTLAAPVELAEGRPRRPRSSFELARRSSCTTSQPPGAVCVPGGAFWMGSSTDTAYEGILAARIVALSPFWLDAHEVTVADLRASGVAKAAHDVTPHSGKISGGQWQDFCVFTEKAGWLDDYPVNCIGFAAAREYCTARGGDLPTEAQFEYAASSLSSLPFVWGRDRGACGDAVLGRGPRSELLSNTAAAFRRECLPEPGGDPLLERLGFPKPVHRASLGRDALVLTGGRVQDLAGSMAEWALDGWQSEGGSCWKAGTLHVDPLCTDSERGLRVLRGASWSTSVDGLPAWWREPHSPTPEASGISIGFRCAYAGR